MASSARQFDPDVLAASGTDAAPAAAPPTRQLDPDVIEAAKPEPVPVKERLLKNLRDGPSNPLADMAHETVSGLGHSIYGGYKGLLRLSTGEGVDAAAKEVTDEQAKTFKPSPESQRVIDRAKSVATALTPGAQLSGQVQPAADALADKSADLGAYPAVSTAIKAAPTVAGAVLPMLREKGMTAAQTSAEARAIAERSAPETPDAQAVVNQSSAAQSMGAASATHNIDAVSPEIQQAIVAAARRTGGAVNPDVLKAHIEAEQHGVQLMKGQATRDPDQFTEEQNSTHPDITARLNAQEKQLVNGLDTVRREATPTNVQNSTRENGQIALDDLKAHDEPRRAAISQAYEDADAANQAAGKGALKLDPAPGVKHAAQALEDREELLPGEGQSILSKMKAAADAGEGIPLKQAETWKTIISRASRKYERSGDTNAVSALSDFRDSLEAMQPASGAAAGVAEKFNTARRLARERFNDLDADPAYKAAVNDTAKKGEPSPLADTFIDDYALSKSAPKSQIDLMMGKLSDEGRSAVEAHTLSTIRNQAVGKTGKIAPSGYNGALQKYQDKLPSLVQPETRDSLESFGRVLENAKVEPPGGKVNYSRSGVVARDAIQSLAEHAVNAKTGGMFGVAKKLLNSHEEAFAREALAPGAGLDQLKTKP